MQHLARSVRVRPVNRQLRADPSVKSYVWSLRTVAVGANCEGLHSSKSLKSNCSPVEVHFYWKRKEFEHAREQTPSLCRFAAHVRADSEGRSGCFRPKFSSVSDRRCGTFFKKINKNGKIKAFCTLCEKTLPYNGATTSNLNEHALGVAQKICTVRTLLWPCDSLTF